MFNKLNQFFQEWAWAKFFSRYLLGGVGLLLLGGILSACNTAAAVSALPPDPTDEVESAYTGKKILFVNSYHEGYEWSDGIEAGLQAGLEGTGVELKFVRLDTKQNPSDEFGQAAGQQAKAEIEAFQPDVVIAADDNAQKYLVVPYLMNTDRPVVFCGVNWDASLYGYPARNVTGMIEVELPAQLVRHLRDYAADDRLGYLTVDTETERKVAEIYNDRFFEGQMKVYWVKTFDEFKQEFLKAQEEVDILFMGNNAGSDRWDQAEAEVFVRENSKIPTGTINSWMAPYSMITLAKSPEEQGQWSAETALRILAGTPVSEIPFAENKFGELILNLDIAEQLDIVFSPFLLKNAEIYAPK